MKKYLVVVTLVMACSDGRERPLTANCKPTVNVILAPDSNTPRPKSKAPAPKAKHEVVQVYWDVSQSMRDFKDLESVVGALDNSVLLGAHAEAVEQYGVGEAITVLQSARPALQPRARRTALHLAAEKIGTALASGDAQAALVVSDMELDTPPRGSAKDATVCGGVPLPSTPHAGSLFGRCFEKAVLSFQGAPRTKTNLLVHLFRKSSAGRELFILLLATDRAFGGRISEEIARRLDFSRHMIFDSGAVAAANVRDCRLTAPSVGMLRTAKGCGAKCFDAQDVVRCECDVRRAARDAWVLPSGRGLNGVTYDSLEKKGRDSEQQAKVRFVIPCTTRPGRFYAAVSYSWREQLPWKKKADIDFATKSSVRDLFESLVNAIIRTVPTRHLRIGFDLAS